MESPTCCVFPGTGKGLPSQKSNKPKSMRKKKNLNCMVKSGFNVQASQTRENQDGRPKMKKPPHK